MKTKKIIIGIITLVLVLSTTIISANAGRYKDRTFRWWYFGTSKPTENICEVVETRDKSTVNTSEIKSTEKVKKTPVTTPTNETVKPSPKKSDASRIEDNYIPSTDEKIASNPATELDGKLSTFQQENVGDCGAVSAIEAIDNSLYGKKLLSSLITVNDNGSYTLNFGAGKQNVSKTEANAAPLRGDIDAKIIEVGLNKAINVYNGCFAYQCFEVITGFSGSTRSGISAKTNMMNIMEEKTKSTDGIIAACDFNIADSSKNIIGDGGHSYSIKSVTSDTVIIVNPWDTSKDVKLSRSWFENSIRYMTYVNPDSKTVEIYWE